MTFSIDGNVSTISISNSAAELAWLDSLRNKTGDMSFAISDYDRETAGNLVLTIPAKGIGK